MDLDLAESSWKEPRKYLFPYTICFLFFIYVVLPFSVHIPCILVASFLPVILVSAVQARVCWSVKGMQKAAGKFVVSRLAPIPQSVIDPELPVN